MAQKTILKMDTKVVVSMGNMDIRGIVVGKSTNGFAETYIIKCTDEQLPNDTYEYDTFIAQSIDINK